MSIGQAIGLAALGIGLASAYQYFRQYHSPRAILTAAIIGALVGLALAHIA